MTAVDFSKNKDFFFVGWNGWTLTDFIFLKDLFNIGFRCHEHFDVFCVNVLPLLIISLNFISLFVFHFDLSGALDTSCQDSCTCLMSLLFIY